MRTVKIRCDGLTHEYYPRFVSSGGYRYLIFHLLPDRKYIRQAN